MAQNTECKNKGSQNSYLVSSWLSVVKVILCDMIDFGQ